MTPRRQIELLGVAEQTLLVLAIWLWWAAIPAGLAFAFWMS